jgi:hypothetical protein
MEKVKLKNHETDQLCEKLRSLLNENGYGFSDADKALLKEILLELEELSNGVNEGKSRNSPLRYLSIVIRLLKFLGIDNIDQLF